MPSFAARLEGSQLVAGLLSCLIDSKKKEQATHWEIDRFAVRVHAVCPSKSTSTTLTLPTSFFTNFSLYGSASDLITFSLDIVSLCDCMLLLGSSHSEDRAITLTYEPSDAVLKLTLEDQGIFTSCDVHVLDFADETAETFMRAAYSMSPPDLLKIIADSSTLRDIVGDFDDAGGPTTQTIRIDAAPLQLRLSTSAGLGSVEVDVPKNVFTAYEVTTRGRGGHDQGPWYFQKHLFMRGMRALPHAQLTLLTINASGMLRVQHMLTRTNGGLRPNNTNQEDLGEDNNSVHFEYICSPAEIVDKFPRHRSEDDASLTPSFSPHGTAAPPPPTAQPSPCY